MKILYIQDEIKKTEIKTKKKRNKVVLQMLMKRIKKNGLPPPTQQQHRFSVRFFFQISIYGMMMINKHQTD